MAKAKFKKNQFVIHKETKELLLIVDIQHYVNKGWLYTLLIPNIKDKRKAFKCYYEEKLQDKTAKVKNQEMGSILYGK
jgi:hypothetical protein